MTKYQILRKYEDTLMRIEDIIGSKETTNIQLLDIGKKYLALDS